MSPQEARRCITACADHMRRHESPRAGGDLFTAGKVLFAAGVTVARADSSGQATTQDLIDFLWESL